MNRSLIFSTTAFFFSLPHQLQPPPDHARRLGDGAKSSIRAEYARRPVGAALLVFSLVAVLRGDAVTLRFYPVLVNLAMLVLFAASLYRPPSLIERLAGADSSILIDHAVLCVVYCRPQPVAVGGEPLADAPDRHPPRPDGEGGSSCIQCRTFSGMHPVSHVLWHASSVAHLVACILCHALHPHLQ